MCDTLGVPAHRVFFISCKTSTTSGATDPGNIQSFLQSLIETFQDMTCALVPDSEPDPSIWQESLGATERQRVLLSECLLHLEAFLLAVRHNTTMDDQITQATPATEDSDEVDIVVAAEALRQAAETLARITGRGESGDVEEVLGVVFEK